MLTLFRFCHAPVATGFAASWQRVSLPAAGGVGDQDAWTLQALDWLRGVYNRLLSERAKAAPSRPPVKDRRGQRPKR